MTVNAYRDLALASLVMMFAAPCAFADGEYISPTNERVRVSLGAAHFSTSTTLRADTSAGAPGTTINAEDGFGLDRSNFEPKFQATVRAGKRNRLSFDYFTLDRSGNTTLGAAVAGTGPIIFRDVILLRGDPVQTKLSLRSLGITYGYSFWHSEKLELAATLAVHVTDFSATTRVQSQTRHIIQNDDQAGPIPTLGIDATWVASKRFYVDARAQYVSAHIKNVGGSLSIYQFDALYRYRPNVSLAVGYSDMKANLFSNQGSHGGRFDFDTRGPEMFFRVAF